jgi:hypothetical protein
LGLRLRIRLPILQLLSSPRFRYFCPHANIHLHHHTSMVLHSSQHPHRVQVHVYRYSFSFPLPISRSVSSFTIFIFFFFSLSFSVPPVGVARCDPFILPLFSFMSALYVLTQRLHLFLAYLSNPSETSFRSYLTEQSFRHHLSRLDDPADSDPADSERSITNYRSSSNQSSSTCRSLESGSSAFHFSNRATVALRTHRHAFHSFCLFTIAAVIPNHKSHTLSHDAVLSAQSDNTSTVDPDLPSFQETWFIGAFGRWWRGGVVDFAWSPRPGLQAKCDEEGWSSGILNIKTLDRLEDYNGKLNEDCDKILYSLYSPVSIQAFPSLPRLARCNVRHLQSCALVINQHRDAIPHHHRFQNLLFCLSILPTIASLYPLLNLPPLIAPHRPHLIILLRCHLRLPTELQISNLPLP